MEDVGFSYSSEAQVLSGITISFDKPELVCIVGPNGVGKSTLVKCINKLITPTHGRVLINGKDVSELDFKEVSKMVSFVAASSSDFFSMPVVDSVLIGRHNHQKWRTSDSDLKMVYSTLKMLELEEYVLRSSNQLSAGQHQRVSLARGIVQDTEIMILDEPTSNLDVKHQVYVTEILRAMAEKQNKLIIMICHDLNIAARYAHTIVMMSPPGVIYQVGTPNEVITAESVRTIYEIDCDVIDYDGYPHVILKSLIDD